MRGLRQAVIAVSTPMMFIATQFPVAETGAVAAVPVPSRSFARLVIIGGDTTRTAIVNGFVNQ
jgi:hypothetical protein